MTNAEGLYERLLKPIEKQMIRTLARIVGDPEDTADVFQEVLVVIQGQAVLLRAMDGSSYHVIANTLGCCEATARSHFSKGRARLAKIFVELGISSGRQVRPDGS